MFTKQRSVEQTAIATLVVAGFCLLAIFAFRGAIGKKQKEIRYLHSEIETKQKRLISAQITTSKLDQVKKLIKENIAHSEADSLAQGASLQFLKDLTDALDYYGITLVTLEPLNIRYAGDFIETPYKMVIECTYKQLCELENKMEKSSRLISLTEFTLENYLEEYFNGNKKDRDKAKVALELTTLTLVR